MVATKKKNTKRASKKALPMKSFVLTKSTPPFFKFQLTHQTFYWTLLSLLILGLGVWVITLNVRVQQLYDQIELSNNSDSASAVVYKLKDY